MSRLARPLLMLAIFVLLACAREEQAGSVGPTDRPDDRSLDGRTFISRSVTGRDLVDGTEIRLTFEGGRLGATAGCNSLGAPYSVEDDVLVIEGDGMAMTEMGCDPPRHDQDQWLADFLTSRPAVDLDGDDLTLRTDDATIEFADREVAQPDRALVGTTWRVDTILQGDTASSAPGVVTLEFPDDRSFVAKAKDCSSATGSMTIGDGTITFDDFATDDIGCPSPWQETLDVLHAGETTYTIEADRLTIEAGAKGIAAAAQA